MLLLKREAPKFWVMTSPLGEGIYLRDEVELGGTRPYLCGERGTAMGPNGTT
jgi:hypothetical protein